MSYYALVASLQRLQAIVGLILSFEEGKTQKAPNIGVMTGLVVTDNKHSETAAVEDLWRGLWASDY